MNTTSIGISFRVLQLEATEINSGRKRNSLEGCSMLCPLELRNRLWEGEMYRCVDLSSKMSSRVSQSRSHQMNSVDKVITH